MVFLASGQYTLSMRTYAPFRNVVRSNQRHDRKEGRKEEEELKNKRASEEKSKIIEGITEEDERKNNKRNKKLLGNIHILLVISKIILQTTEKGNSLHIKRHKSALVCALFYDLWDT